MARWKLISADAYDSLLTWFLGQNLSFHDFCLLSFVKLRGGSHVAKLLAAEA
jgi:hypothetical protein